MNRIDSLDWQRGLLALAIMAYHLTGWELFALDSTSILGRLGIYGVSMFFVLSGLSMAVVYNNKIVDLGSSVQFFVRRIFRIWPLFWLVVAFAASAAALGGQFLSWKLILLNLTTAFGFVRPSAYINTGAWSIGNEMVYYAFTPLLIWTYNRRLAFGNLLTGVACLSGLWFSSHVLVVDRTLAAQWVQYVNPFNNLFLYCAGLAIYYNSRQAAFSARTSLLCFAIGFALFILYPAAGDQIHIVTGFSRIVFSIASIVIVIGFYKNTINIPRIVSVPLTQLGVITYGVYLLHPVVYQLIAFAAKKIHFQLQSYGVVGLTMVLTVLLAQLSFKLLEKPFIRIGKRLTTRPGTSLKPKINDGAAI